MYWCFQFLSFMFQKRKPEQPKICFYSYENSSKFKTFLIIYGTVSILFSTDFISFENNNCNLNMAPCIPLRKKMHEVIPQK